jgi:hypothetical protein
MVRLFLGVALGCAVALSPGGVRAQNAPVYAMHPILQASVERIGNGSALWRTALATLSAAERQVIVLTPDQLRGVDQKTRERLQRSLAEAAPVVQPDSRVDAVVVVINVTLLEQHHQEQRSLPIEFDMDVDRLIVHEIYGHAVPYLIAGHVSGQCADPLPEQKAVEACSIRRENAVRAELGLGRRVDYGLAGLNLARRTRQ